MIAALWKFLDKISNPVTLLALLVTSAALIALGVVQQIQLASRDSTIADLRVEVEKARADHQAARADASEAARLVGAQYRSVEIRYQTQKEEAEARSAQQLAASEARNRVIAAERNRLLDKIAAFTRGPAEPAQDSLAACRVRAETCGVLLGKADQRTERDARELEELNREKRLLLDAWPRDTEQR